MTDVVNHPGHYSKGRFTCECITISRHLTFTAGNAVKYIWRHREKNGVEDLRKAAVYLRWAIEDREMAWIYGHSAVVRELVVAHVATPLGVGQLPAVYQALLAIGMNSDFREALSLVEQAIAEYECAPIVLPAEQFDQLMAEADQADDAPKLAEAAVKPRTFGMMKRAACGCLVPEHLLYTNGRAECYRWPVCSGNSGIPCGAESGNFPNIGEVS